MSLRNNARGTGGGAYSVYRPANVFKPNALLDTSQVEDRRGENFLASLILPPPLHKDRWWLPWD